MTYLVVGGGIVGTFLASTLAKNGGSVVLKTRGKAGAVVGNIAAKAGVELVTTLDPLAREIGTGKRPQLDAIFVATKTYHLADVAQQLRTEGNVLEPRLATIGCYNGHVLDIERTYQEAIGGRFCKTLVPGGYSFKEDGTGFDVTNASQKWALLSRDAEVKQLAAQMSQRGVATVAGGFEADTRKYLVNNTANLVSVIANTNCQGLVSDQALLGRMRAIFRESAAVLRASPRHAPHFPDTSLDELEEQVLSGIASYGPHYPSSCKDYRAGREIEVESLNGYIVALGKELGIETPVNQAVVDDVNVVLRQGISAQEESAMPIRTEGFSPIVRTALRGSRIMAASPIHQQGQQRERA
mmetsp:Transcript_4524/g.13219  ORF Transcript_4524/g.13219 Transcript_4524/m.13219 type:complete len:355 (-) Transcript_4524:384-1448(-)